MKHKTGKHLTFFAVLEALQHSRACPLCALESACLRRYFEGLLYERVNDPRVRQDLHGARGYCSRHAHRLVEVGDGFGISILYLDLVRDFARFLGEMNGNRGASRLKDTKNWVAHQGCPACRLQFEARERHIQVLLNGLREPEMRDAFQESAGLCLPHFFHVKEAARDVETQRFVSDVMQDKYSALTADLTEFQRKREWRHAHEPFGKESDSWIRAVKMMVGERDLF